MNSYLMLNLSWGLFFSAFIFYSAFILAKRKILVIFGNMTFGGGLFLSIASVINRGLIVGYIPLANSYETLLVLTMLISISYLFLWKRDKDRYIATVMSLFIVLIIAITSFFDDSVYALPQLLKSNWLTIHVSLCLIAYSAFAVSFIASILLIMLNQPDKFGPIIDKSILLGFPLLTLGIITGSIWAKQAWGRYWNWDPKEVWALITWAVYAVYLYGSYLKKWRKGRNALVSILGFMVVLFTYFGVNYLFSSLHSYK